MKKLLLAIVIVALITGCNAPKQIIYLQDAGKLITYKDSGTAAIPDAILKVGDILNIVVNSTTPEASQPFNLPLISNMTGSNPYNIGNAGMGGTGSLQNYLIDTKGDITYPILGKIHVAGMTKTKLSTYIKEQIYPRYITEEPIILVRFGNFKISVLGEVNRPGVCAIDNEKVSILEAIAMAGDLTLYGKRDNILLIRETNGKRETVRLNLLDKRLIDSPYYYLQQNDILYVQPNNPKANSSVLGSLESFSMSAIGTFISLISFIIAIAKK